MAEFVTLWGDDTEGDLRAGADRQFRRVLTTSPWARPPGARGYRPGAVDGRLSAETVAALRAFEADQGMVPKGRISVAVLERLQNGIAGGGRHPTQ